MDPNKAAFRPRREASIRARVVIVSSSAMIVLAVRPMLSTTGERLRREEYGAILYSTFSTRKEGFWLRFWDAQRGELLQRARGMVPNYSIVSVLTRTLGRPQI